MARKKGNEFGEELITALEEAVAFEAGELPGARVDRVEITARHAQVDPPPQYPAARVRSIRRELSVSQQVFADLLNASPSAVRAWEQGTRQPDGPTRRLLQVAEGHPEWFKDTLYGRAMMERRRWPARLEPQAAEDVEAETGDEDAEEE